MSSRLRTSDEAEGIGCFGSLLLIGLMGIWLGQWISGLNTLFAVIAAVGGLGLILMISGAILTANAEHKQQRAEEQRREDEQARLEAEKRAREEQRKAEELAREEQRKAERLAREEQREAQRLAREQQLAEEIARYREEIALTRLYTWNQQFDEKPWASHILLDPSSHLSSPTTDRLNESLSPQDRKLAGQVEAETRSICAQARINALESILALRVGQIGWQVLIDNSHTMGYPNRTAPRPEAFRRLDHAGLAELTSSTKKKYTRLLATRETEYAQALTAWNTER